MIRTDFSLENVCLNFFFLFSTHTWHTKSIPEFLPSFGKEVFWITALPSGLDWNPAFTITVDWTVLVGIKFSQVVNEPGTKF
jgi:hypothetical protein